MASIFWLPVVFSSCSALLYWLSITLPALPAEVIGVNSTALRFPSTLDELRDLAALLDHYCVNHLGHVVALYSVAYLFKQAFAVPGSIFLNLLGGAIFGQWVGFVLTCFLSASGATCCFLLAKVCGRSYIVKYFPDQLNLIQSKIEQNSDSLFFFLMFLRLFPMTPNWFLNMASPICGVPTHLFFLSVFFGLMPYNFISVQTGSILSQLTSMDKIFTPWTMIKLFTMATVALVPGLCIKRYQEYYHGKQLEQKEAKKAAGDTEATIVTPYVNLGVAVTTAVPNPTMATAATTHPKRETISTNADVQQPRIVAKHEACEAKSFATYDCINANVRKRKIVKPKVKMTEIAEIPKFSRRKPREALGGRTHPLYVGVSKSEGIVGDEKLHAIVDTTQRLGATGYTVSHAIDSLTISHVNRIESNHQGKAKETNSGVAPIAVEEMGSCNQKLCQNESLVEETAPLQEEPSCETVHQQDISGHTAEKLTLDANGETDSSAKGQDSLLIAERHIVGFGPIVAEHEQVKLTEEDGWITEDEEEKEEEVPQNSTNFQWNLKKETNSAQEQESCEVKHCSSFHQENAVGPEHESWSNHVTKDDSEVLSESVKESEPTKAEECLTEESGEKQENIDRMTLDEQAYHDHVIENKEPTVVTDGLKDMKEQGKCSLISHVKEDVKEDSKSTLVDGVNEADLTRSQESDEYHKPTDSSNSVHPADPTIESESGTGETDEVFGVGLTGIGGGDITKETNPTQDKDDCPQEASTVEQELNTQQDKTSAGVEAAEDNLQ